MCPKPGGVGPPGCCSVPAQATWGCTASPGGNFLGALGGLGTSERTPILERRTRLLFRYGQEHGGPWEVPDGRRGEWEGQIWNVPWKLQCLRIWRIMFARKIRCFENVCSLYSLSAQKKPTLLAKGAAGAGVGPRQEAGNWSGPRGGSGGERGRGWQQTGFPGPLSGSCRGCGCPHPLAP